LSNQEGALTSVVTPKQQALVGASLRRKEDRRFLTGQAQYITNVKLPGMLHAVFVRSSYAHARVLKIDASKAESHPGVYGVYTWVDFPDSVQVPCAVKQPFIRYPFHYPIAKDEVRYVGEIVAIILAESDYIARDAAELVEINYEPLVPVVDPEDALTDPPKGVVHKEIPDNIACTLRRDFGDVEGAFARASHRFSFRIEMPRVFSASIEPRSILSSYDPSTNELVIWISEQFPHLYRMFVSRALGHPESKIRVIAPDMGGAFGAKGNVYPEELLIPLLSIQTKRSIGWTETRSESFVATTHARDIVHHVDVGVSGDGKIEALRVRLVADLGAYFQLHSPDFPMVSGLSIPCNYKVEAYSLEVIEVFTNKVSVDAYRGVSNAEPNFCMERLMNLIAAKLGLDPVQMRLRNLVKPGDYPYTTITGSVIENGNAPLSLQRAVELIDYEALRNEQSRALQDKKSDLIGIGFASYLEASGYAPPSVAEHGGLEHGGFESALVRALPSGDVVVITGSHSHGQGHETAYAQIASDILQIDPSNISIQHGDTLNAPFGVGTFGSRSASVGGAAVSIACERLMQKARLIASYILGARQSDLEYINGEFRARDGSTRISFMKVAREAYLAIRLPFGVEPGLEATCYFNPPNFTYSMGTHVAIVAIERETGKVKLRRYLTVDDFGTIINPMIVEGQIHGAAAQGVGQALLEKVVYDEDGQILTSNFLEYLIPTAQDPWASSILKTFETHSYKTDIATNPLGVKGMGEAGIIAAPAAIVNAVQDALCFKGLVQLEMPLKPEAILAFINNN